VIHFRLSLISSRLRPPLAAALLLGLLSGCGGGGGSKPSPIGIGVVSMFTDFSGAPAARRVRYTVSTFDGLDDKATVVAKTADAAAGQVRTDLSGLPSGTLHLHGTLLDAAGTTLAEMDALVDGSVATAFETVAGATPTTVSVAPQAVQVPKGQARRFFATARTAERRVVFVPTGTFVWTTADPTVATVADGPVAGVGAGSTTVTATFGASGVAGSAAAIVTSVTRSKWTVLVYLNAANDLAQFSLPNFNQMEQAAGNAEVRTVVQWKTGTTFDPNAPFSGTRRYLVKQGTGSAVASTLLDDLGQGVDMGSAQTLADFVAWGRANFPADRTMLIVWNHGNGWRRSRDGATRAVSYDDEFNTAIQAWELSAALGDTKLEVLAWDASLMQMLEVAYGLRDRAAYIVGSEESPPGEGYPYDVILGAFRDNPDASTRDLTKAFVDAMLAEPAYATRKITQSVLDASKLDALATSVDIFAAALVANRVSLTDLVPTVRAQAQSYSPSFGRVYRDLYDVADRIAAGTTVPAVAQAATNVKTAITDAFVWEGHNAQSPGSRGIAIDFSSATAFSAVRSDYANLELAQRTTWDDWLTVAP